MKAFASGSICVTQFQCAIEHSREQCTYCTHITKYSLHFVPAYYKFVCGTVGLRLQLLRMLEGETDQNRAKPAAVSEHADIYNVVLDNTSWQSTLIKQPQSHTVCAVQSLRLPDSREKRWSPIS